MAVEPAMAGLDKDIAPAVCPPGETMPRFVPDAEPAQDENITVTRFTGPAATTGSKPSAAGMVTIKEIAAGMAGRRTVALVDQLEDSASTFALQAATDHLALVAPDTLLSTSSSSGPSALSSEAPDDEGPRGRRIRKSVNYKEPSLTK
jgi:hypothetical protein